MLSLPRFQLQYQLQKMEGRPTLGNIDESPLEVDPTQEKEEEQGTSSGMGSKK